MKTRVATGSDLDGLTATLTAAFESDPLRSWAFPDPKDLAVWWRFVIGSALRYPCVWITDDYAAASVWIPPEGTELTEEEEKRVKTLLNELIGSRARVVMELLERFEASHPTERHHYYLSLLGTHPTYRGQGLGMALLAENLERMDGEGFPAYLESRAIPETTPATSSWALAGWVSSRLPTENAPWRRCGAMQQPSKPPGCASRPQRARQDSNLSGDVRWSRLGTVIAAECAHLTARPLRA